MKTMLVILTIAMPACNITRPQPNPLDQPGSRELTDIELHLKNLKQITGNPAYR